jgi:hypothetical protein
MDSLFTLFRRVTALTNYWNTKIYRRKKKQKTTFIFFCVLESFIIFRNEYSNIVHHVSTAKPRNVAKGTQKKGVAAKRRANRIKGRRRRRKKKVKRVKVQTSLKWFQT